MVNGAPKQREQRVDMIRAVQTPLGFFVLVVLVVEVMLGVFAGLGEGFDRALALSGMIALIFVLIGVVAFLAYSRPEALFGKRGEVVDMTNPGAQKIRLYFDDMVDIRKLDRRQASCTFVDSTAIDAADIEPVTPQIISDEREGPFINVKIPDGNDYVYVSVELDGHTYNGSLAVHSRMVNLQEE